MTKEETINKAIEIEFGLGNNRSIREHNSSLVKVAEYVYDLLHPSLPSNLGEAAEKYADEPYYAYPPEFLDFVKEEIREAFKAGVVWMAKQHADDMGEAIEKAFYEGVMYETKQGVSYQATISANKTIPVLPMKDVSDMGLDYGDNVIVQIRKKD